MIRRDDPNSSTGLLADLADPACEGLVGGAVRDPGSRQASGSDGGRMSCKRLRFSVFRFFEGARMDLSLRKRGCLIRFRRPFFIRTAIREFSEYAILGGKKNLC